MTKYEQVLRTIELIKEGVLQAPADFLVCPISTLETICNGCGSADSKFDFVPDTMWSLYIGYACHIHDYEYEKGETKEHKKIADKRFHKNMRALIKLKGGIFRFPRYVRAYLYYAAVKRKGYPAFFKGKEGKT